MDCSTVHDVGTGVTSSACGTSPSTPISSLACEDKPQPDGDYRYRVTALHHGWTAVSEPSGTVTVDATAPAAPSAPDLVASSDSGASDTDDVTHHATATFTGTAEAGSTVRLYSGPTLIGSDVATAGAFSVITSPLPEGEQVVTAKATDVAGNASAASSGTYVTVDTVAPTVSVARLDGQSSPTKNQPIRFAVTFSQPVTGFTAADVTLTAPAGASAAVTGSGATYTVEVDGMTADGSVSVSVGADAARDLAGNASIASQVGSSVTLDTAAPPTPAAPTLDAGSDTGSSTTDRLTNDTTPTFTGSAEAGSTITLYEGQTALGSVVAGTNGSWSIVSGILAEGVHTLTVTATDAAGNTGAASDGTAVTVDVTAPAAPSSPDLVAGSDSGASSTDNYTNDTTSTFTGTAADGATVTLYDGTTPVGAHLVDTESYSITTAVLGDESRAFTVTASDTAGNASTSAETLVTIDTSAPTLTITSVSYHPDTTVTTTGSAGYAVGDQLTAQVTICSENSWPCTSGVVNYTGTPSVSRTTGSWSDTSTALGVCGSPCTGPGQIHVRATQTDLAGNVGISSVESRIY